MRSLTKARLVYSINHNTSTAFDCRVGASGALGAAAGPGVVNRPDLAAFPLQSFCGVGYDTSSISSSFGLGRRGLLGGLGTDAASSVTGTACNSPSSQAPTPPPLSETRSLAWRWFPGHGQHLFAERCSGLAGGWAVGQSPGAAAVVLRQQLNRHRVYPTAPYISIRALCSEAGKPDKDVPSLGAAGFIGEPDATRVALATIAWPPSASDNQPTAPPPPPAGGGTPGASQSPAHLTAATQLHTASPSCPSTEPVVPPNPSSPSPGLNDTNTSSIPTAPLAAAAALEELCRLVAMPPPAPRRHAHHAAALTTSPPATEVADRAHAVALFRQLEQGAAEEQLAPLLQAQAQAHPQPYHTPSPQSPAAVMTTPSSAEAQSSASAADAAAAPASRASLPQGYSSLGAASLVSLLELAARLTWLLGPCPRMPPPREPPRLGSSLLSTAPSTSSGPTAEGVEALTASEARGPKALHPAVPLVRAILEGRGARLGLTSPLSRSPVLPGADATGLALRVLEALARLRLRDLRVTEELLAPLVARRGDMTARQVARMALAAEALGVAAAGAGALRGELAAALTAAARRGGMGELTAGEVVGLVGLLRGMEGDAAALQRAVGPRGKVPSAEAPPPSPPPPPPPASGQHVGSGPNLGGRQRAQTAESAPALGVGRPVPGPAVGAEGWVVRRLQQQEADRRALAAAVGREVAARASAGGFSGEQLVALAVALAPGAAAKKGGGGGGSAQGDTAVAAAGVQLLGGPGCMAAVVSAAVPLLAPLRPDQLSSLLAACARAAGAAGAAADTAAAVAPAPATAEADALPTRLPSLAEANAQLVEEVGRHVSATAHAWDPRSLAVTLWAAACIGQPCHQLFGQAAAEALMQGMGWEPAAGERRAGDSAAAPGSPAEDHEGRLRPHEVANALWAFARHHEVATVAPLEAGQQHQRQGGKGGGKGGSPPPRLPSYTQELTEAALRRSLEWEQEGAPPRHLIKVLWASSRLGLGLESGPGAERAAGREGGGRGGRGDADGVGTAVATASSELGSLERRAAERVAQAVLGSGGAALPPSALVQAAEALEPYCAYGRPLYAKYGKRVYEHVAEVAASRDASIRSDACVSLLCLLVRAAPAPPQAPRRALAALQRRLAPAAAGGHLAAEQLAAVLEALAAARASGGVDGAAAAASPQGEGRHEKQQQAQLIPTIEQRLVQLAEGWDRGGGGGLDGGVGVRAVAALAALQRHEGAARLFRALSEQLLSSSLSSPLAALPAPHVTAFVRALGACCERLGRPQRQAQPPGPTDGPNTHAKSAPTMEAPAYPSPAARAAHAAEVLGPGVSGVLDGAWGTLAGRLGQLSARQTADVVGGLAACGHDNGEAYDMLCARLRSRCTDLPAWALARLASALHATGRLGGQPAQAAAAAAAAPTGTRGGPRVHATLPHPAAESELLSRLARHAARELSRVSGVKAGDVVALAEVFAEAGPQHGAVFLAAAQQARRRGRLGAGREEAGAVASAGWSEELVGRVGAACERAGYDVSELLPGVGGADKGVGVGGNRGTRGGRGDRGTGARVGRDRDLRGRERGQ